MDRPERLRRDAGVQHDSFLLTKLRNVGDVLLTTPALRALRRTYPRAHITMVVRDGNEEILLHNPHIDRVLVWDRTQLRQRSSSRRLNYQWEFFKQLRDRRYDTAVDFASGDRAVILGWLAGASCRIGLAAPDAFRRFVLTKPVRIPGGLHTVDMFLSLLKEGLGVEANGRAPELHLGREDEEFARRCLERHQLVGQRLAFIHIGASNTTKLWPLDRWAAVADALQTARGLRVIFTGLKQEAEATRYVCSQMKSAALSLAGQTSVLQLAALLAKATLFIGNDSGPMHLAAAMGTRVVGLFGATDPVQWRPVCAHHVVVRADRADELPGPEAMSAISVQATLEAVDQILGHGPKNVV